MRILAFFLDVLDSLVVPFLFGIWDVYPGDTDGNSRGEDEDALDVATERFRISSRDAG